MTADVVFQRELNYEKYLENAVENSSPGFEAELKKRTLTNLCNARPAWLDDAHKTLYAAVAITYGWSDYTAGMPDEAILRRLLALNLGRP